MQDQILELTKKLIILPTTSDNPKALNKALDIIKKELKTFTIESFNSGGYKSILVYNTKTRPKKFRLILNGHLDIIPAKPSQYNPFIQGDKLYGAGSMDMKASVACITHVFKHIAKSVDYPIGLQIVTDEEIGGFHGTKHQISQGAKSDFVIAAESTQLNIVNQAKGVLWIKVTTTGKTAHGAYPWKGENAILKMTKFLNNLSEMFPLDKEHWTNTVNISQISTPNQTMNKIPDSCTVYLDIRYLPNQLKTVTKQLNKILPQKTKLEILAAEPFLSTDSNNQDLQLIQSITQKLHHKLVKIYGANGTSDARHYSEISSGIEFGPIGGGIGSDHEWVSIQSLAKYSQILTKFIYTINS